jgi:hypothetical protein
MLDHRHEGNVGAQPTAAELTAALQGSEVLDPDVTVIACRAMPLGSVQLGDSFRAEIDYSASAAAPSSVFVKLPPSDARSAVVAARIGAFERGRYFYANLRPLRAHVEGLEQRGVKGWDLDTAFREHRRPTGAVLMAMVAALAFVQATARGFDMFASILRRGAQQALDHDLLSFL